MRLFNEVGVENAEIKEFNLTQPIFKWEPKCLYIKFKDGTIIKIADGEYGDIGCITFGEQE